MKNGKEVKLSVSDNYKVVSGTVDNKKPKSIYINISTWGQPKKNDNSINYDKVINNIHRAVQCNIKSNVSQDKFIKDKVIVDLDMRKSGVGFGKRSFMNCEITLFQITSHKVNSDVMQKEITDLSKSVIEMFETDNYFTFHKTKK